MLTQVQQSGPQGAIRPFFLRLGYEVNNPENNYCPDRYKEAYRKLIRRLREAGLVFASVWHVVPGGEAWDWEAFYPGDEWVDWIGTSTFFARHLSDDASITNYDYQEELMEFAEAHNKPVMIAESSPVEYGVAICPDEGGMPNSPEESCGVDNSTASGLAWQHWFQPYFNFINAFDNIKAVCYINSDWEQVTSVGEFLDDEFTWKKDARLGQNDYTRDAFRAEVQGALYKTREDVDSTLGGCQPISVITDGQEWMRLLPTGDFVLTKGSVHAGWTDWSATGPMKNPLAYAIANASGQILLAITADTGDLYLRGQVFEQQVIDRTALPPSFIFAEGTLDTDPVICAVTNGGDVYLVGSMSSTGNDDTALPPFPFPAEYEGFNCSKSSTAACECFRHTAWWEDAPCLYSQSAKSIQIPIHTVRSSNGTPVVELDSLGNCRILNGDLLQDGSAIPQGSEQIVLAELNGTPVAMVIVREIAGQVEGDLWIQGHVIVAASPSQLAGPNLSVFVDPDNRVRASINGDGDLVLDGLVLVRDAISREVYNWPFAPFGGTL